MPILICFTSTYKSRQGEKVCPHDQCCLDYSPHHKLSLCVGGRFPQTSSEFLRDFLHCTDTEGTVVTQPLRELLLMQNKRFVRRAVGRKVYLEVSLHHHR